MSVSQSWEEFLDEVVRLLEPYSVDAYRWPELAVISAPTQKNPSQAAQIVVGICSRDAEECASVDADGNWVDVGWRIRYQRGEVRRIAAGGAGADAVRRIASWPLKSESGQ